MVETRIGTWHEREAQEMTRDPSSYAADWMKIRTKAGDYPAYVSWDLIGFLVPMPQDLHVAVDAEILDGAYYSGFGGVNFASTPIPPGPHVDHRRLYAYQIKREVEAGRLTLDPDWQWLAVDDYHPHLKTLTPEMIRVAAA